MNDFLANSTDWTQFHPYILKFEEQGLVTRTFRRLDPERQEAILIAIVDEAAEHGPAALNIKRVAERADVAVGSLYQYFPNRNGMLDFAVELCVRFTTDSFDQYRPYIAALPLREALTVYLTGGIEWSRAQAGLIRLFARAAYQGDPELADSLVQPIATLLREMVADILVAARERGEIRPEVDLEALVRIVHALMIATGDSQLLPYLNNYYQVVDDSMPPERLLESLLDFILEGIGAK